MIKYKIKKEISLIADKSSGEAIKTRILEDSGSISHVDINNAIKVGNYKDYNYHVLTDISEKEDSCIVVGGSPNILNYEYGDKINTFDKVIRVNSCPVEGFETHVGTKTNIWASSMTVYKCFDEGIVNARDHAIRLMEKLCKGEKNIIPVSSIQITGGL